MDCPFTECIRSQWERNQRPTGSTYKMWLLSFQFIVDLSSCNLHELFTNCHKPEIDGLLNQSTWMVDMNPAGRTFDIGAETIPLHRMYREINLQKFIVIAVCSLLLSSKDRKRHHSILFGRSGNETKLCSATEVDRGWVFLLDFLPSLKKGRV